MSQQSSAPDRAPLLTVALDPVARRITPRGELDLATAPLLRAVTSQLLNDRRADATIEVGALTFLDASGLGCLVEFSNALAAVGARLTLTGTTARQRWLFGVAGLGEWTSAS